MVKRFTGSLIIVAMLFFFSTNIRLSAQEFERQLKFCTVASLWLPVIFENAGVVGEDLCKAGGGSSCYSVTSLGEGICKAGGGSSCYSVTSLREGICKASGICNFGSGSAIEIINAIVGACGTRVLHYGF